MRSLRAALAPALALALVAVALASAARADVPAPSVEVARERFSDGRGDGEETRVEAWGPRGTLAGEEVVAARAECHDDAATARCLPRDAFVGGHHAPAGQDARWAAGTPWRSAGGEARLEAAGHALHARAGTFHFWWLQYYFVEADLDGERVVGVFDAVPLP